MSDLKLNETPVRTARNFNCNNIVLKDLDIPENYEKFNSVKMDLDTSKINVEEKIENLLKDIHNHISKVYLNTCGDLYTNLQNDFDYLISDEAVKETLVANDYCFNEYSYKIEQ